MSESCKVCGHGLDSALYESPDNLSITTMNKLIDGRTRVFFCDRCGHLQTSELPNLEKYYAEEYEINLASEGEDQLYAVVGGKPIYRAEHQAAVLLSKVSFPEGCRVLDYGCAKAPTLKKVLAAHPSIEPFLFDVTDKYVPFWRRFPKMPQWSVNRPDASWRGAMDVVLSFYALEHVSDLAAAVGNIKALLKEGGTFYFLVPNVYKNIADFIVADHINHFSKDSLQVLLEGQGFTDVHADDVVHDAAFVVTAVLSSASPSNRISVNVAPSRKAACHMAQYWQDVVGRIRQFEASLASQDVVAVYGAGFYGNFIVTSLAHPDRVRCVVDQNKYLQGSELNCKPVVPPDDVPPEVTHVLVGMNPRHARANIHSIASWNDRPFKYFFL
jgi:SAM-dependent methyltransferase